MDVAAPDIADLADALDAERFGEKAARLARLARAGAAGPPGFEISERLGMSPKTVDSHRLNIREKLGLATARDLVRYAVRWAGDGADGEGVS